jgi:hypothetical protein
MRKLALLAMLALVVGFVPMTSAGSQVEAQADGNLHIVNGIGVADPPGPVTVCEGTDELATGLSNGDTADISLSGGVHSLSVALTGAGQDCTTATPIADINVVGGQDQTLILGPAPNQSVFSLNDTSTTPADTTRLTLRNSFPIGDIGICVGGELVDGTLITGTGVGTAQAEVPSGPTTLTLYIGVAGGCQEEGDATLAACTNLVFNVFSNDTATAPAAPDNELFIVGCELPTSDQALTQFCEAVNPGLQAASASLDALFAGVKAPNPETYPPPSEVEAVVDQVNAAIALGDASVPDTIRPQWEIVTSGLRQLVAGLTAASFDFDTIGQAGIQEILDGMAEGPDAETQAAIDVLTDFYVANCLISGEPTFTG